MIYKMTLTDSADSMTMDLLEVPIADNDVEGAVDNTTIDGNVFTDYLWLKKKYVQKWSIMCPDEYDRLRGFYTRQWTNASPAQYRLFYGENIFTDYSESGDYIVVNNPSDISAPVTNFAMYGDATQETYSGKNKLPVIAGTAEDYGITATIDEEGVLTINGTTTTACYVRITNGVAIDLNTASWRSTAFINNLNGTTFSIDYISGTAYNSSTAFRMFGSDANHVRQWYPLNTDQTETFTSDTVPITCLAMFINANLSFLNSKFRFQLESGSTATSFEKFVGGIPSPNPQFPQEVRTVTGENTLKIVGKNLFDIKTLATGGVSVDDGVAVGQASAFHTNTGSGLVLPFTPTGQLTITATAWTNGNQSTAETGGLLFRIIYTDGSTAYPQDGTFYNSSTTPTTLSFTTNSTKDVEKICISYGNAGGNIWHITNIQIEEGASATEFEDFSEQEQKINLVSKNLVYETELPKTQAGVTVTYNDGVFSLDGTASANSNLYILPYTQSILHLEAGESATFYLERVGGTSKAYFVTYFVPDDGSATDYNWQLTMAENENSKTLVKTATKAGSIKYVQFFINKDYVYDVQVKVMVQKGNIANPTWAGYFTPIELAEIGTHQDNIKFYGSKWVLHEEIKKIILDGDETWSLSGNTYFTADFADYAMSNNIPVSDHFIGVSNVSGIANVPDESICFNNNNDTPRFYVRFESKFPSTYLSQWLKTNPTKLLYILETPTDTEITDSTLLSQLNAIYELYVKSGKNSIIIIPTSPNLQPDFDIGYRVFSEQETDIVSIVPVRINLTDDGVINTCGCRRNIQLTMRETTQ